MPGLVSNASAAHEHNWHTRQQLDLFGYGELLEHLVHVEVGHGGGDDGDVVDLVLATEDFEPAKIGMEKRKRQDLLYRQRRRK